MAKTTYTENERQMDTSAYGDFAFPLMVRKIRTVACQRPSLCAHWHRELQFTFVVSGRIQLFVEETAYTLSPGQGAFINRCRAHTYGAVGSAAEVVSVDFNEKLLSLYTGSRLERKYVLPIVGSAGLDCLILHDQTPFGNEALLALRRLAEAYFEKTQGFEFEVLSCLFTAFANMLKGVCEQTDEESALTTDEQRRLNIIISYIQTNYAEKIRLQELADMIYISKAECCRFFKRTVMSTIFEFLNNFRLNKSIELLRDTDIPVNQVALDVGFGSASYYTEYFKKYIGCTPTEFRKDYRRA